MQACIGDWIIYYEPRKLKGTRGYYAIARLQQVIPDPADSGMYVAIIEPGSYLDFARPVPFTDADSIPVERGVLNEDGRISGRAQAAVRPISPTDFDRILALGLDQHNDLLPRLDQPVVGTGFAEIRLHSYSNRSASGWPSSPTGSSGIECSDASFSRVR